MEFAEVLIYAMRGDGALRCKWCRRIAEMLEDMGGRMQSLYLTMGQYDLAGIFDAPDDAIAARFTLMIGQLGNVRTTTMKAFPEEAYRHIVDSLR
jgi:uncharacterized protein with GYD domain